VRPLFDENLSHHLPSTLQDVYSDSIHVRECGLAMANDEEVWAFAIREQYAIVSKDADFHQRSFLRGYPPKVIWLRLGNCSTQTIGTLLRERVSVVTQFLKDAEKSFLALSK